MKRGLLLCLFLTACSPSVASQPVQQEQIQPTGFLVNTEQPRYDSSGRIVISPVWDNVRTRLHRDGIRGESVDILFSRLGDTLSQKPMGTKVKELYTRAFFPPAPAKPSAPDTSPNDTGIPRPWFKGMVTTANAEKCRAFIQANQEAFDRAEIRYNVPAEVAAALLYIETRHGSYLGVDNAFVALSSMASSRKAADIPDWLEKLPDSSKHLGWIEGKMQEKSDWAYKELKALLVHCSKNNIDPFTMPGSVYGAVGMCQFMPTNLPFYAADGDDDGIIDVFTVSDAVASLSNYLVKHGWKADSPVADRIKVLRRYNNLAIYANSILALAEMTKRV